MAKESKGKGRGNRDKSAIPDEIYDALINQRQPPVMERTRAQQKLWWRTGEPRGFNI